MKDVVARDENKMFHELGLQNFVDVLNLV